MAAHDYSTKEQVRDAILSVVALPVAVVLALAFSVAIWRERRRPGSLY